MLRSQSDSPAAAEDLDAVGRVVPHKVEVVVGAEPLGHGLPLTAVNPRVQVPRQEGVHLGVQRGEEPPVHGEDLADVAPGGNVPDVTDIQVRVGAGEAAEPGQHRILRLQVVVNSDGPARVVDRQQGQVLLDTLTIMISDDILLPSSFHTLKYFLSFPLVEFGFP